MATATIFFDEVKIPAGKTKTVKARIDDSLTLFKGTKLLVTEEVDMATVVSDILIGGKPQIQEGLVLPSAVFCADTDTKIEFDTWTPSLEFKILVTNRSENPVLWSAQLEGEAQFAEVPVEQPVAEETAAAE